MHWTAKPWLYSSMLIELIKEAITSSVTADWILIIIINQLTKIYPFAESK